MISPSLTCTQPAPRPRRHSSPFSTTPIGSGDGSALDPLVEVASWRAWKLVGASHRAVRTEATANAAHSVFRLLTEQLWIPGKTVLISNVTVDPSQHDHADVVFAVGVLGSTYEVGDEATAVDAIVDAQLGRDGLPFNIRSVDASTALAFPQRPLRTCVVRQKMLAIDDGDGDEIPILMRWNPTVDPWLAALRLLVGCEQWLTLRVTALPTEIAVTDREQLDSALRQASRMRSRGDERVELIGPAERALATLTDIGASFGSPLLCGELALVSDTPIAERLARSIGTCFTSETDVLRRSTQTLVASQQVLLGGFEVDRDPPRHVEALRLGLPLRGGLVGRDLRDVWTITETPIGWPVPVNEPVPGVPSTVRRRRPAPDDCTTGVLFGHDWTGAALRVTEPMMRLHVSISGRSGTGKSALKTSMAEDDLSHDRAFLFIDPDGPAADRLVARAAETGKPMIVIDAMDGGTDQIEFAPLLLADGSNLFEVERAVRRFVGAIVSPLPVEWAGPRFSLNGSAQLMPACAHGLEVAEVVEMLADEHDIRRLLDHPALPRWVRNQLLGQFSRTNNDATSVREWTTSKFAPFFTGPARLVLAAPGRGIDLGEALLLGVPVVVNLAGLPRLDAQIVGHLVVSMAVDAIVDRGAVEPEEPPIRLYVDEAPRFPAHNLELLLTGGRKFGAALVLACQNINQYDDQLADLVLGAEVQVAFAQTPAAAAALADHMELAVGDLVDQPDMHAYVRIGRRSTCSVDTPAYSPCPPRPPRMPVRRVSPSSPQPSDHGDS